ncbi:MAG: hypothetical protein Q8N54_10020 [Sulfurimicrobium sp.]|nr:hypothetical protein [Sulfurimicrobium sp.]
MEQLPPQFFRAAGAGFRPWRAARLRTRPTRHHRCSTRFNAVEAWSEGREMMLGFAVIAVAAGSFLLALRLSRRTLLPVAR